MRFASAVLLTAAAPAVLAAPVPSLLGDIFADLQGAISHVTTTVTSHLSPVEELAKAVKKLGTTLKTNAGIHGNKLGCNDFTFPKVDGHHGKNKHDISWPAQKKNFINWRTYKSNGVNLGAWLEQEQNYDYDWWAANIGDDYPDEWTWCGAVGFKECGPKLEARYSSFFTTADIDKMGKLGINTLRIPTTYAAWVKVPYSNLYHGNQQEHLRKICNYAIDKYGMHVILSLHSLPGGINTLSIGEAFGHNAWFQNTTHLEWSFKAADSMLSFIKSSGRMWAFTVGVGNEFSDNFEGFATPSGLSEAGTNWINTWTHGVLARIAKIDKRIPVMLQDSFFSEKYWSPFVSGRRALSTNLN